MAKKSKTFQVFRTSLGQIETDFPHSPEDRQQSYQDYLDDKAAAGLIPVCVPTEYDGGEWYFLFKTSEVA